MSVFIITPSNIKIFFFPLFLSAFSIVTFTFSKKHILGPKIKLYYPSIKCLITFLMPDFNVTFGPNCIYYIKTSRTKTPGEEHSKVQQESDILQNKILYYKHHTFFKRRSEKIKVPHPKQPITQRPDTSQLSQSHNHLKQCHMCIHNLKEKPTITGKIMKCCWSNRRK